MRISSLYSHILGSGLARFAVVFGFIILGSLAVAGQSSSPPPIVRIPAADEKNDNDPPSVNDLVIKQRISRQKKEYDEMLKRGDEALKLSEELESSFEDRETFSTDDIQRLQALEKVVSKIRDDLGGDDKDDKSARVSEAKLFESDPKNEPRAAIKFLRNSTLKLVEELKKSTRFSISVAAIETTNVVIRLARYLRLKS